jgi:CRISP-associated protein Cas1
MTERILDFSEQPAGLSVRNDLLVVRQARGAGNAATKGGKPSDSVIPAGIHQQLGMGRRSREGDDEPEKLHEQTIPLEDIAVIVAAHPQVTFTLAVVAGLARHGGLLVTCDEKRQPAAMMLPLDTHHVQTVRYAAQAQLSLPARKRLWQQIVRAKIAAQARLLVERNANDGALGMVAGRVRSGDPGNMEAHAARIYWRGLMGESFRRSPEGEGLNSCLNYGYAVLRAAVARAICAAGLHPTFGLHHRNQYDAFCLADDLMEPFRPLVDRAAVRLGDERGPGVEFDRDAKRALLEPLLGRFAAGGESRSLFDWLGRCAFSLAAVVDGSAAKLEIPELHYA